MAYPQILNLGSIDVLKASAMKERAGLVPDSLCQELTPFVVEREGGLRRSALVKRIGVIYPTVLWVELAFGTAAALLAPK